MIDPRALLALLLVAAIVAGLVWVFVLTGMQSRERVRFARAGYKGGRPCWASR
jgi:Tfp pilus assembly protein PilO